MGTIQVDYIETLSADYVTTDDIAVEGPYVDARAHGASGLQTTIASAITDISTNNRTLYIAPGTWNITSSLSIASNINVKVERGAVLAIATGVTLTINGTLEAGDYPIFSFAGTGKVAWNSPSVANARWWGALGDDSNNDQAAIQAAIVSIYESSKYNVVRVPTGIYRLGSAVTLYPYVTIKGDSHATVFKPTANAAAFVNSDDIAGGDLMPWRKIITDCTIDASANSNDIKLISLTEQNQQYSFENIYFRGNSAAEQIAFYRYAASSGTPAAWSYNSLLQQCAFHDFLSPYGAIHIEAEDDTNGGDNYFTIRNCYWRISAGTSSWRAGTIENYNGLVVDNCYFNTAMSDPILQDGSGGKDVHWVFGRIGSTGSLASVNATFSNCWFEGANDEVVVLEYQRSTSVTGVTAINCTNFDSRDSVFELSVYPTHFWTATYVNTTTCTVSTDITGYLYAGRRLYIQDSDGNIYYSTIATESYDGGTGLTTITIDDARFTTNLAYVFRDAATNEYPMGGIYNDNNLECYSVKTGSLTVGIVNPYGGTPQEGTAITGILAGSATIDPGNITALTGLDITITVTGIVAGARAFVNPPSSLNTGVVVSKVWTTNNTINIGLFNATAGALNPASGVWYYTVLMT